MIPLRAASRRGGIRTEGREGGVTAHGCLIGTETGKGVYLF